MTDVSVIVPTFNRPELLARALGSLAEQTIGRGRFEVLVVDDCGLDPADVVEAFAERLDVQLLRTPENSGLAASRNVGIAAARGRYLAFLDDDDCLYPEHLEVLLAEADRLGGEAIVYSDAIKLVEDRDGTPLQRQMIPAPATFSYERLLVSNFIHAMSPLVPRSALADHGGFDPELRALEDWELWLRLGAHREFHHVWRATADYRVREGAVNNTTRELPLHLRCTQLVYARYPVPHRSALARSRARYLEQHRAVAEQHAFEVSVVAVGATRAGTLRDALVDAGRRHAGARLELLAYVPDHAASGDAGAALHDLAEQTDGRLVLVTGADVPPDAAFAVLERKVAGARIERVELAEGEDDAGSVVDDDYCIRAGYRTRAVPEYYEDTPSGITWQPDVYPEAQRVARVVGARTVVDIGSGNGAKLAQLHPELAIVGVDMGANLDGVRARYPQGTWIEHDLDVPGALPLEAELIADSVVVCADVIEHLVRPELLLRKLRALLDAGAAAIVLSTPERAATWGADHAGPPPNPCHVREWTIDELGALLERAGFEYGDLELTRSNDADPRLATSMALLYRDADIERRVRGARDAGAATG